MLSRCKMRGTATAPNSPRESEAGEVWRRLIHRESASKSKVRQTVPAINTSAQRVPPLLLRGRGSCALLSPCIEKDSDRLIIAYVANFAYVARAPRRWPLPTTQGEARISFTVLLLSKSKRNAMRLSYIMQLALKAL